MAMADSDHRRGVTTVSQDLLEPLVAATTSASSSSHDEEEEEDGFTFAAVPCLPSSGAFPGGRLGPVYPVFGRPRSPPAQEEEDLGTATVMVPLRQLLMEERGAPSAEEPADEDGEGLDGVPAETYCLWSPGASPSPAPGSRTPSPARCRKSGSTGSVLRWRQRVVVGRSHSDGKEKFVFLKERESFERSSAGGGGHGWMMGSERSGKGGSGDRKPTFLPYKQDLVGFFANAGAFRRSYLPF